MRANTRLAVVAMLALVALCASAGPAHAVPWFPTADGLTFTYSSGTIVIHGSGNPDVYRSSCWTFWPYHCDVSGFSVDTNGDVRVGSVGASSVAMPDPDICTYDPPLMYLDFPLETGKVWSTQATVTRDWQGPQIVSLEGRVVGPATVTVPAGTFDVIIVALSWIGPDGVPQPQVGELWLHHQLGPINNLVSWTGVVGIGPISWGSLKATYR